MNRQDWTEIGDLFAAALEQPPGDRARFVLERCGERPDWLEAVNRLLAAERSADSGFLDGLDPGLLVALRADAAAPEQVGAYRLLRQIGTGGMGQVFLAERADGQFEQRTAVKLLKRGMDSDAVLTRFLRERQILAGLDHPHIARLLDGGVADDGRPFFVMELVDGQPITRYCDDRRLTTDQRLALVRTVCLAVEYAHRNLVVHRDLKPSNILVTAEGEPKLLDFGIAKLLSAAEGDAPATTLTRAGGQLLTPEYAAPEQFRGGPVTTSTDVYSLGAVLYELLTGERPFPGSGIEDRLGQVELEPPPMSSRVSGPERRRRLAGDLDVIVAKALRASPERRYPSMEGLREDLRRHQERLPVMARPDTLGYRASRFIRRHRAAVVSAAVIAVLVLLFGLTATLQAVRIRRQSDELAAERDRARREATAAQEVSDFLVGVFQVSDPQIEGLGDSVTARQLLDRGAAQIDAGLADQPELQARLLGVIGRAYTHLLHPEQAEPLLLRGVELWRSVGTRESSGLVAALQQLADTRTRRGDFPGAEQALRQALALPTPNGSRGSVSWPLYVDLATMFHAQGAVERARPAADTALRLYHEHASTPLTTSRSDLARLAQLLTYTKQWDEMEEVYARLVDLEARERGPRSAAVALLYNRWAGGRIIRGNRQAADSLHQTALAIQRELAPRSVATARTLSLIASNALWLGTLDQADSLSQAAIEIYLEKLGEDHPTLSGERARRAEILRHRGRHEDAVELFQLALASYRRSGERSRSLVPGAEWRLAVALRDAGRPAESLTLFRSALAHFEKRYPADFLSTAQLRRDYGTAFVALGRGREAEALLRRAIAVLGKRFGPADYRVDGPRITLGRALTALGRRAEADTLLQGVEARLTQARGPADSLTQRARAARDALRRARSRPPA
ncbi:MAG TPA: serine/threonine-protein kinase [Gemmatimonadales bacterium]